MAYGKSDSSVNLLQDKISSPAYLLAKYSVIFVVFLQVAVKTARATREVQGLLASESFITGLL